MCGPERGETGGIPPPDDGEMTSGLFSKGYDVTIERYRGPRRIRLDGERLASLRIARNYSLAYVASACGVTRQAVCLWEQERAVPDDRCCDRLAALFGVDLAPALSVRVWE